MRKATLVGILAVGIVGVSAAAGVIGRGSGHSAAAAAQTETEAASELAQEDSTETASGDSRSLIVYFDYSENIGDTSDMTPDAITSASLDGESYDGISTNDLLVMKDEIQKQTGADVFSVRVNETYDPNYDTMVGIAQEDENNNKQFTFVDELPDLSNYDTIYMGTPVWWGQLPQPMVVFLTENDFSGKTIVPFGIHLGSRFGRIINQYEELQPNANVIEDGLTENSHTPNEQVIADVDEWLSGLSLS